MKKAMTRQTATCQVMLRTFDLHRSASKERDEKSWGERSIGERLVLLKC